MSELVNNMFEKACDKSWLFSLDMILLTTMMKWISMLRIKQKGKEGVVENLKGILHNRWNQVAAYEVYQLQENGNKYTIIRKITIEHVGIGKQHVREGLWQVMVVFTGHDYYDETNFNVEDKA